MGWIQPTKQNHPARSHFTNCSNSMARLPHSGIIFYEYALLQLLVLHTYEKSPFAVVFVVFSAFIINLKIKS